MRLILVLAGALLAAGCGTGNTPAPSAPDDSGQTTAADTGSDAKPSQFADGAGSADATGANPGADADTGAKDAAEDRRDDAAETSDADGGNVGGTIGDTTGAPAVSASAFLATIGVCVHVAQGADAPQSSATAIAFAGIRNVRDDGNPSAVPDWISMHQQVGVRVCMLPKNGDVATTISMAKQLQAAGALLAIEGPNEPNNWPVTYQGQTSSSSSTFLPIAQFQRDLYAAVHSEPMLTGVPVFASSEAGGAEPDNVGLQFLTIPPGAGATMPAGTKYADYANTHNYVSGHSSKLVDNVCWQAEDPTLNGDWDGLYVEYGRTWQMGFAGYSNAGLMTLPRVTTETGWPTTGTGSITQEQQARVFLNLYLAAYKRGWAYTFIYMLRDDPVQGNYGLFDTNYQPKTSGTYLHNLTTILADSASRTPGLLNYVIANSPPTVHDLLMQKSDGTFELAVWNERPSGGSDSVTVNLGRVRASVKAYDPTMGTSPTQTLANVNSVQLTLSDHPIVLEI